MFYFLYRNCQVILQVAKDVNFTFCLFDSSRMQFINFAEKLVVLPCITRLASLSVTVNDCRLLCNCRFIATPP